MKKIALYLSLSVVFAGVLAVFTPFSVSYDVLNTIYTVAGVIFSVGMSIAITPKTERVTNERMRAVIRSSYRVVRNSFMYLFGISTFFFIVAQVWEMPNYPSFWVNLCSLFILLSVIYYIYNFVKLQKLGVQIEDQILKEEEAKKGKVGE